MNLLEVDTLQQAVEKIKSSLSEIGFETEEVSLKEAYGRVLAWDIVSRENIPDFRRSTVAGYGVVAADTQGASESVPSILEITGQVLMGRPAEKEVHPGECMYVPTGGMVPEGADAVVMIEHTEIFGETEGEEHPETGELMVYSSLPAGLNVVQTGEDIARGDMVIPAGKKLLSLIHI